MDTMSIRREGEPRDVAVLVAFLFPPLARHVDGAILSANGGGT